MNDTAITLTARSVVATLYPLTKKEADKMIRDWHSHHKPSVGWKFGVGAKVLDEPVGCVIVGRPSAQALDDGYTWEVTRLCCRGGDANVASKLLAAACDASFAQGVRLMISYTRQDEPGTCYKASSWVAVAEVTGKPWTGGNKSQRWLPGLYDPSTEIVDRVRWERRPTAHIQAVVKLVSALGRFATRMAKHDRDPVLGDRRDRVQPRDVPDGSGQLQ